MLLHLFADTAPEDLGISVDVGDVMPATGMFFVCKIAVDEKAGYPLLFGWFHADTTFLTLKYSHFFGVLTPGPVSVLIRIITDHPR